MSDFVIAIEGIGQTVERLGGWTDDLRRFASMAINKTIDRTRVSAGRAMRKEIAFPAHWLTGADSKLIATKTGPEQLSATIRGRFRPTSLATFAKNKSVPASRKNGVHVEVATGHPQHLKKAFLMTLPQGSVLTETQFNLGLAVRLKPGETIQNKKVVAKKWGNIYLLYGPSVDQVFRTVAEDVKPDAADFLENEFDRLLRTL